MGTMDPLNQPLLFEGPALCSGQQRLSYADLEARVRYIQQELEERGIGPGKVVALLVERSPEGVAGWLGVLRTGACVAPLDIHCPAARLEAMLERLSPAALICQGHGRRRVGGLSRRGIQLPMCLALAEPGSEWLAGSEPGHVRAVDPDAAYAMFTSGSTGEPKCVVVGRQAVRHLISWAGERFAVGCSDRMLCLAPLHFDMSVLELLLPLASGGCACLAPPLAGTSPATLANFLEQERITLCYLVASVAGRLAAGVQQDERDLSAVRAVILSGEPAGQEQVTAAMDLLPGARLYNLYGSTEVCACTVWKMERPPTGRIYLGGSLPGMDLLLVGEDGEQVEDGRPGEIWAAGPLLLTGHLDDPAMDQRRLVMRGGRRYLRTGDWARRDRRGGLIFVGRRDAMIKIRGLRVDLSEVEAVLLGHPAVAEAAAVGIPDPESGYRIRAAVTMTGPHDLEGLERHCAEHLPSYMLPERILPVDAMPLTRTGKIHRPQVRQLLE